MFGGRGITGALTGDPATADATLRFSRLAGVTAMIETVPLEGAPDAYARMTAGQARFRIVLTMDPAVDGDASGPLPSTCGNADCREQTP